MSDNEAGYIDFNGTTGIKVATLIVIMMNENVPLAPLEA